MSSANTANFAGVLYAGTKKYTGNEPVLVGAILSAACQGVVIGTCTTDALGRFQFRDAPAGAPLGPSITITVAVPGRSITSYAEGSSLSLRLGVGQSSTNRHIGVTLAPLPVPVEAAPVDVVVTPTARGLSTRGIITSGSSSFEDCVRLATDTERPHVRAFVTATDAPSPALFEQMKAYRLAGIGMSIVWTPASNPTTRTPPQYVTGFRVVCGWLKATGNAQISGPNECNLASGYYWNGGDVESAFRWWAPLAKIAATEFGLEPGTASLTGYEETWVATLLRMKALGLVADCVWCRLHLYPDNKNGKAAAKDPAAWKAFFAYGCDQGVAIRQQTGLKIGFDEWGVRDVATDVAADCITFAVGQLEAKADADDFFMAAKTYDSKGLPKDPHCRFASCEDPKTGERWPIITTSLRQPASAIAAPATTQAVSK